MVQEGKIIKILAPPVVNLSLIRKCSDKVAQFWEPKAQAYKAFSHIYEPINKVCEKKINQFLPNFLL
jgi:hypothetical protein